MTSRYVVLGLARPRIAWFGEMARWSTGAALPVEFLKCVSAQEIRTRLGSGRRVSAALLDAGVTGVDRDLVGLLRSSGVAALVIDDGHVATDWIGVGASAVLAPNPTRSDILDALAANAMLIEGVDVELTSGPDAPSAIGGPVGTLVAVTGPGGVGTSATAIALAQGLAGAPNGPRTLLADFCLRAEQSLLHDTTDVVPGLPELLDAHRGDRPGRQALLALTWHVEDRGYDLLLGLRRASDWPIVRTPSLDAALDGLRATWQTVVADVDACVEGEAATGSLDVQDRHLLARTVLQHADLVVVVGRPGMKWMHGVVHVVSELAALGVAPARMQPVMLGGGRRPRRRAEITRALADLVPGACRPAMATPIFLPHRDPDTVLRDGTPMPAALVSPLTSAILARLAAASESMAADRSAASMATTPEPIRVRPGELGFLAADEGPSAALGGEDAA